MRWWRRLAGGSDVEHDLDAELRYHLERLVEDNLRAGMSADEARRQAILQFGGLEPLKERCRDARIPRWLADLAQDARFGVRLLLKDRWFAATAVLALATGMAVTSMMTTVLNGYYFRGLPGGDGHRILSIGTRAADSDGGLSFPEFRDLRAGARTFAGMAAFAGRLFSIADPGQSPETVAGRYISANAFELLGVAPMLGRGFRDEDDRPAAAPVVMLGHRLWSSRYHEDRGVIGRVVRVNDHAATVIGVMPKGFEFPYRDVLWQPLSQMPGGTALARHDRTLSVFGLLASDAGVPQARSELQAIAHRWSAEYADTHRAVALTAIRFGERQVGRFGSTTPPLVLAATAVFVLVIACANLAGLLLARSTGRAHEIAIRTAIGATRWRLVRQLLVETLLLTLVGGAVGLGLSRFGVAYIADAFSDNVPYWMRFTVDWTVLAIVGGFCAVSALLSGVGPALYVSRSDLAPPLHTGPRSGMAPRVGRWTATLVTVEVAVTLTLLAAAGLMVRSFLVVHQADRLVDAENLLTVRLDLPDARYHTAAARAVFYDRLEQRLSHNVAIASAAVTDALPFGWAADRPLTIEGPRGHDAASPGVSAVSAGRAYFEVLDLPLLRGRGFAHAGDVTGANTAIVNQRFVEMYFPDRDPLGARIRLSAGDDAGADSWLTIIGVSPAIRQGHTAVGQPVVYVPWRADSGPDAMLMVRPRRDASEAAAALRREIAALDPELSLFGIRPLAELRDNSRLEPRLTGALLASFAAMALLLSAVALYSVTSYAVQHRTHEAGVRMALGARPGQVVWMVVRRGMRPVVLGAGLGVAGGVLAGHVLRGLLIGTSAVDPLVLGAMVLLLTTVASAACLVPARRAASVDIGSILRHE